MNILRSRIRRDRTRSEGPSFLRAEGREELAEQPSSRARLRLLMMECWRGLKYPNGLPGKPHLDKPHLDKPHLVRLRRWMLLHSSLHLKRRVKSHKEKLHKRLSPRRRAKRESTIVVARCLSRPSLSL